MKTIIAITALLISSAAYAAPAGSKKEPTSVPAAAAARADIEKTFGFVPSFFRQISDHLLPSVWEEMKSVQMNPKTALGGKMKELIGLAVAAQVPCTYCAMAHTEFARAMGASEEELGVAIGMAARTRQWTTSAAGMQLDASAFLKQSPLRSLLSDETTPLGMKEKSLIGLAVASQIPSPHAIAGFTTEAKASGATAQEIAETVEMAALTRSMSTLLNGHRADLTQLEKDVRRILAGMKRQS